MVVGFNHNIMYRGEMFHVQTEDSGINNPHIITLLYRGGTILASKKTSYADILKIENLAQVVEELMKEQHKDVLRRLKNGEFDGRAFPDAGSVPAEKGAEQPVPSSVQEPVAVAVSASMVKESQKPVPPPVSEPAATAAPSAPSAVTAATPPVIPPPYIPSSEEAKPAKSLDEIILNYLVAGDD